MDLNLLDVETLAEQGSKMPVLHPVTGEQLFNEPEKKNGEPKCWNIYLKGTGSKSFKKKFSEAVDEMAAKQARQRQAERAGKKAKIDDIEIKPFDVRIAELCDELADLTVGWEGITEDGIELQCSKSEAARLYLKYEWLRNQAKAFVDDAANFIKA